MTPAGRRTRPGRWAIPVLATAALVVAVAAPGAGAGVGTPPPSTSPSGTPPPSSAPPVITTPPSSGPTKLVLEQQPAWVPVGGELPLALRIDGPVTDDMTIAVTSYSAISTRIGYEAAMRGDQLGLGTLLPTQIPIAFAPPDGSGTRTLRLGMQSPTGASDANLLPMRATGVYPVELELRAGDGGRLSGFVTPVVAIAPGPGGTPTVGEPLNVAWVWPMADRPATLIDGSLDPAVVADLGTSGKIGGQAIALANHDVPVTIAPGPETLETWQFLAQNNLELTGTLEALKRALARALLLNSPYVPIDVPSLAAGGFGAQVGDQLRKGADTLLKGLGVSGDEGTAVVDPIDSAAVSTLRGDGVSRLLVRDTALVPRNENLTPARPFRLRGDAGDAREVTAVASDSGLARLLEGPDPPALRAQRFLAELAVIAIELPNLKRGVVVLNPTDDPPDLAVLNAALTGLSAEHPLLAPKDLRELFSVPVAQDEATGENLERELAPITPAAPPVTPTQYQDTERTLGGYNSLLPGGPLAAPGEKSLFVSLSSAWKGPAGRARAEAELNAVSNGINQFVGGIHAPVNPTITVTASTAEIPVTFLNDTDQTVHVRVRLASDDLTFPDGPVRDLELPPRNTTVRFAVEARGSGTFPLALSVTSPDGSLQLQQTEVQVRSTFVSNVGVFLTVGAVLFLALWWGNDFRRRRKRKAAAVAPDPGAEAQPPSTAMPGTPQ